MSAPVDPTTPDFRLLADMLPQIVWTSKPEGGNAYLNQRWYDYTGLSVAESLGEHRWALVLHPDDQVPTFTRWQQCVAAGVFFEIEYRLRRHDGQYRWFLGQARPVLDADGRATIWFGTCTDIDDRKRAESQFGRLADMIPQLVWTTDPRGSHKYFNERWTEFTGWTMAESLGTQVWNQLLHPDDQQRARERWEHSLRTGEFYEIEYRFRARDGSYRWFLGQAQPVRDDEGRITEWFGTCTDIHDQRQRQQHLNRLVESPVIGVLFFDLNDTRVATANDRYLEIIGRTRAELEAGLVDWATITPPEYQAVDAEMTAQLLATGTHEGYEKEYLRSDGTRIPVLMAGSLTEGTQGVSVCIDLSPLRRAQTALREREQELETLANNIPQLAWIANADGWIFWYNRRWYDYTGTTLEDMQGWGWQKVHHPDYVDGVRDRFRQAIESQAEYWEDTFPLRGTDGQYRWFLSRAVPIRDADGMVIRWFGTNTDVTEQRQLQEQLRSSYADLETKITFRTLELEREVQRLRAELGAR